MSAKLTFTPEAVFGIPLHPVSSVQIHSWTRKHLSECNACREKPTNNLIFIHWLLDMYPHAFPRNPRTSELSDDAKLALSIICLGTGFNTLLRRVQEVIGAPKKARMGSDW